MQRLRKTSLHPAFLRTSQLPPLPASWQFSTIPGLHCIQTPVYQSRQWLERQLKKQVPAEYFLLTFTLPEELRPLAWQHQRILYDLMIRCSWETLKTFTQNDPQLQGQAAYCIPIRADWIIMTAMEGGNACERQEPESSACACGHAGGGYRCR